MNASYRILLSTLLAAVLTAPGGAEAQQATSKQAVRPRLPFTAAIRVGDTHYISGWGSRDPKIGRHPEGFEAQVHQLMINLRNLLERQKLDLSDVVHTHAYLTYPGRIGDFHRIYAEYFPNRPPALTTMGIPRLPATEVEITFVASHRRDVKAVHPPGISSKQHFTPGIQDGDFLYISDVGVADMLTGRPPAGGVPGQVRQSFKNLESVLQASGMGFQDVVALEAYLTDLSHMEIVNGIFRSVFATNPPARTTVGVTELPDGAPLAINVIAARRGRVVTAQGIPPNSHQSPAIRVGDRLFLSGRAGTANGGAGAQVREVMDEMFRILRAAGMSFSDVVKGKVYLTDMNDYAAMNEAYGSYFSDLFPTRSCIEVGSLPLNAKVAIALTADASPRR